MDEAKIRAGETLAAASRGDPVAQAALARSRLRLRLFNACLSLHRAVNDARNAEWTQALQKLAPELQANRREWEAVFGEPYPSDLDDWIRQATRAGVDPNAVDRATLADLAPKIEGHLLRLRDQAQTKPNAMLVEAMLIAKKERDEPYTSYRELVKELQLQLPGVSLSMVRTAFDKSHALTAWKEAGLAARARSRKARVGSLNGVHEDTVDDNGDGAVWARFLAEASPAERAQLNAMSETERAKLIQLWRDQLADDRASRRTARERA